MAGWPSKPCSSRIVTRFYISVGIGSKIRMGSLHGPLTVWGWWCPVQRNQIRRQTAQDCERHLLGLSLCSVENCLTHHSAKVSHSESVIAQAISYVVFMTYQSRLCVLKKNEETVCTCTLPHANRPLLGLVPASSRGSTFHQERGTSSCYFRRKKF